MRHSPLLLNLHRYPIKRELYSEQLGRQEAQGQRGPREQVGKWEQLGRQDLKVHPALPEHPVDLGQVGRADQPVELGRQDPVVNMDQQVLREQRGHPDHPEIPEQPEGREPMDQRVPADQVG